MQYEFDDKGNQIGKGKAIVKGPKTKKGIRPLPLLDVLYEVLKEWYDIKKAQEKLTGISFTEPDDYLFANNKGKMRSSSGTSKMFQRFLTRHKLNNKGIHFHALRQTFSNALFADESDEKTITDLLGHSKISTSKEHYNSIDKFDSVQKAAHKFNLRYKPKNPKYCAGEDITFAPQGYITELDNPISNAKEVVEPIEQDTSKRPISELLEELTSYP